MEMSDKAKTMKAKKHEDEEKGQQDVTGPDLKALMKHQFSGEVGKHEEDKAHAKRMEEFIEEKMGTKKQEIPGNEVKELSEEDKLFLVPDDLNPKRNDQDEGFDRREGFSGEAAPLFMNTGIAEVSLPVEFRLRNIEETDKARAGLNPGKGHGRGRGFNGRRPGGMGMPAGEDRIYLRTSHGRQHRHGSGSSEYHSSVPSSAAADYNNHKREWAEMMDRQRRAEPNQSATNNGTHGGGTSYGQRNREPIGRSAASDDLVYERFKKRERNRR